MTSEQLLVGCSCISETYIQEAEDAVAKRRAPVWLKPMVAAACIGLVAAPLAFFAVSRHTQPPMTLSDTDTVAAAPSSGTAVTTVPTVIGHESALMDATTTTVPMFYIDGLPVYAYPEVTDGLGMLWDDSASFTYQTGEVYWGYDIGIAPTLFDENGEKTLYALSAWITKSDTYGVKSLADEELQAEYRRLIDLGYTLYEADRRVGDNMYETVVVFVLTREEMDAFVPVDEYTYLFEMAMYEGELDESRRLR